MIIRQCFFILISVLCWTSGAAAAEAGRPNLILFLIDDQDFESVSAYSGRTWTPNLDRMAAEGMRFTQAHVSSTVCTPSRYTWLTGRYAGASTSRVYDDACGGSDQQGFPSFNVALERDRMNVGHLLREAGYTTGFVGKFHVGSPLDPGRPEVRLEEYTSGVGRNVAYRGRRLVISRTGQEARFRVVLCPFRTTVEPAGASVRENWAKHPLGAAAPMADPATLGGFSLKFETQTHRWTFAVPEDGRSRIHFQRGGEGLKID